MEDRRATKLRPLVSIITPSFNQGKYIEETIQSVLSQDYPRLEYLVIDGASTDETLAVLRKYTGRLRWISESDTGQSEAINKGIRIARGEIIAWLNSDDTFLPGAVSTAVNFMESHPETKMVYGEGYLIDEKSEIKQPFPATEPFNLWRLIYYGDYILQQTVFMRKEVFEEIGNLDESLHYGMDWDLWIRIGKRFKVSYIPYYLANLREYPEAKTFTGGMERFRELVGIIRRHGNRQFPPSYFNYGFEPCLESFLSGLRRRFPWVNRHGLSRIGRGVRKVVTGILFRRIARLSQPSPFADGWLSNKAHFLFPTQKQATELRVVGSTRQVPDQALPMKIAVRLNGRHAQSIKVDRQDEFTISQQLPSTLHSPLLEVVLTTNKSFVAPRSDSESGQRRLAFELKSIGLATGDLNSPDPEETGSPLPPAV